MTNEVEVGKSLESSSNDIENDDTLENDDGLNDHDHDHDDNEKDIAIKFTETDDEFEQLLPPKPNYEHADDDDLDQLMGIELKDLKNRKSPSKKAKDDASLSSTTKKQCKEKKCCVRKYGNTIILNTSIYNYTNKSCCLIGPHFPGPIFTFALLLSASYYFTKKAFDDIGSKTGFTCIAFTITAVYNLCKIVFVDPGIVKYEDQVIRRKKKNDGNKVADTSSSSNTTTNESDYETILRGEEEGWSYCAICQIYQPPGTVHCSDCGVCVEEYDHHCPWMGTCIGKKNMGAFMRFNCTWLAYLIYCCVWVLALGPIASKSSGGGSNDQI